MLRRLVQRTSGKMYSQDIKRVIFFVFIVLILCSCTKYSEEWAYNESEHWHSLIHGNTDATKKDVASHDWEISDFSPSCVEGGYSNYKCRVCGLSMKKNEIKPLGHNYVLIMSTQPTCEKKGYDTFKCTRCGDSYTTNETNPLGHNYLIKETVSPTCNLPGYDLYECSLCNRQIKDHFVYDYSDHEFVDGICSECGCLSPEFCVEISSNGTIRIKDELRTPSKSAYIPQRFVLPNSINGIDVKAIQDKGFSNCPFKEVVLPDTIKTIGEEAFSNCVKLEKINLSINLQSIGRKAFLNCISLKECILPDSISRYGYYQSSYGNIDVSSLFDGCVALKTVTVGSNFGVTGYDSAGEAIYNFKGFSNCPNLEAILVSSSNKRLQSIDGILYSKDGLVLINCPAGRAKDVVVPVGTETISSAAFRGCEKIRSIILPSSIYSIGGAAFSGCQQLEVFELGGASKIGDLAFSNCTSIKELELGINVKSLGGEVFSGWGKDQTIIIKTGIPDGCTGRVGTNSGYDTVSAWKNCDASIILSLDQRVTKIGYYAFMGCNISGELFLPIGLESIGREAFASCEIDKTIIPSTVTSIGESAFSNTLLREIEIPSSVTSVGGGVFYDCKDLEKVIWNARRIDSGTFSWCQKLSTVILSDELEIIERNAFNNCSSLKYIVIPNPNTILYSESFPSKGGLVVIKGDSLEKGSVIDGTAIIPEGVKKIGDHAFSNTTINNLAFPSTLTEIGYAAFSHCDGSGFNNLIIPDSVKTIGPAAFCDNFDLKSVSLNAETIGEYAFSTCPYLERVIIGKNLKKIGERAFWLNYSNLYYYTDFSKWEAARKKMTITYEGSEIEWISRVSKESGWNEHIKDNEIGDFSFLQ